MDWVKQLKLALETGDLEAAKAALEKATPKKSPAKAKAKATQKAPAPAKSTRKAVKAPAAPAPVNGFVDDGTLEAGLIADSRRQAARERARRPPAPPRVLRCGKCARDCEEEPNFPVYGSYVCQSCLGGKR